ncbi:cytochrome c [Sphingomonas sp.]|uniref:c-type cytochrome n=1 Tax=Sphingomonas sp. TaxID=28214 RepID=UPI002C78D00B|nr:cytochrome c [Sphingomonas sp.]HWK36046.1 cytochrome c [Sphingomonas sp.]
MRSKHLTRTLPVAVMILSGSAAIAATASQVIAARQARYTDLGKSFKAINDQLKAGTPDLAVIRANATTVARLAQLQHRQTWFPAGTQAGQGLKTAAKPAIWQNAADFTAKRTAFANAAASYGAIAAKGDINAIKAATASVGQTCKSCHESYRDRDKS